MNRSSQLLEVLRGTLEELNRDPELPPNDPELLEFKRSITKSIEELESKTLKKAA